VRIDQLLGITEGTVAPPQGWGNPWGITYGGFVAAAVVNGLERVAPPDQPLSGATLQFARPLMAGVHATIASELVYKGRTASGLSASLEQGGELKAAGSGWATATLDEGRPALGAPSGIGDPDDYVPEGEPPSEGAGNDGVRRHLDVRPVPTEAGSGIALQWMRLAALQQSEDEPWSPSAIALVADMVGVGQHRAVQRLKGPGYSTVALDLTIHIGSGSRGEWLLGVFGCDIVTEGRTVGNGRLFDRYGVLAASLTQLSLVRKYR
jgi:hypothetical protein